MRTMTFSNLYLLSQREQRGLQISFGAKPAVVRAGNGFGKSAVVKSLYDAFGASPHKIDQSWQSAQVATVVEFAVDGEPYAVLKVADEYTIFDASRHPLLRTRHVVKELGPFLAELLDFRLVMTDKRDNTIVPPPAYMFAPFYIDQDRGWSEPWSSFARMYLPDSKHVLAEYHSGLKPNFYYVALAERERLRTALRKVEAERKALDQSLLRLRQMVAAVTLNYSLEDFEDETQRLLVESERLHAAQVSYREELATLNEEKRLWSEQSELLKGALAEMDGSFMVAHDHPVHVECPTCGHDYDNSLVERFALIEDYDGLLMALIKSRDKSSALSEKIQFEREKLKEISARISSIESIFSVRKSELTFRDVVTAEGRNEALRIIRDHLASADVTVADMTRQIEERQGRMDAAISKKRATEIQESFVDKLTVFSEELHVRLDDPGRLRLSSMVLGRGSEGPRGLIAYYYAFLHTARAYSSSAFCPIVIDAPNQQAQDDLHMPKIMRFIVRERPADSQVIVATESLSGLPEADVDTIDVGKARNQVLREEDYAEVAAVVRPYLGQLL